jgi:glycosyltransferase involved in cell wall biosynthesis
MRALVITSSFPRGPRDVSGIFVAEWCHHLKRLGHDLDVLTWASDDDPETSTPPVLDRVRYAPESWQSLFYRGGAPENLEEQPSRYLLAVPAFAGMLARAQAAIGERDYDVIVGHWLLPSGLIARALGRSNQLPSVVIGHSGGIHALAGLPEPISSTLAAFVTDGVTTVSSRALRDKLRALHGGVSAEVLPMGFEPTPVSAPREQRRDWLFMGRMVEIKGVDLAIRAFAEAQIPEDVTLRIAGDGPELDRLRDIADEVGANVVFEGVVRGPEKSAVLGECGFGIFPSMMSERGRTEGMPVAVMEILSAGIVPLVSGMPGIKDLLADSDLQYVRARGVDEWARRVERLARFPLTRLDEWAERSRYLVSGYAWPRLALRWDGVLRRALRRA